MVFDDVYVFEQQRLFMFLFSL